MQRPAAAPALRALLKCLCLLACWQWPHTGCATCIAKAHACCGRVVRRLSLAVQGQATEVSYPPACSQRRTHMSAPRSAVVRCGKTCCHQARRVHQAKQCGLLHLSGRHLEAQDTASQPGASPPGPTAWLRPSVCAASQAPVSWRAHQQALVAGSTLAPAGALELEQPPVLQGAHPGKALCDAELMVSGAAAGAAPACRQRTAPSDSASAGSGLGAKRRLALIALIAGPGRP